MALYEGLKLDAMLGKGSEATVSRAFKAAPVKEQRRWHSPKVEVVGSGQSKAPRGKKGLGRAILIVLALGWGLTRLRSTESASAPSAKPRSSSEGGWSQDLAALFKPSTEAERAKLAAREALEARKRDAAQMAHLAALPVDPAGGTALALWQDGAGRWWQVNGKAELRPSTGPAAKDSLGLPELRGVSAIAEERGAGKRLSLRLPSGLLKALLPLEPSVASEVRALLLDDPEQPALLTHDGTRCLLEASDWQRRQKRLGLVLADLAAKKRRATLIDLRYEDTAVVRPAGRG